MRYALILNRSAGGFRRHPVAATVAAIRAALAETGADIDLRIVARGSLPAVLTALAANDDYDAVVVGGGDGTILTAVAAGLGRSRPLGILPLGTLNLFARDIGLPLDPTAAARALARAGVGVIDLAEINGLPFAIWASIGLHPWIVRRRDHLQRRGWRKPVAMLRASLRGLCHFHRQNMTLRIGAEAHPLSTPMLFVTNNSWREEIPPLSRHHLDGGRLEIHAVECRGRLGLIRLLGAALLARWRASPLLRSFSGGEAVIELPARRVLVSIDGEVRVLQPPLRFRIQPRALKVLMPSPPGAGPGNRPGGG